MMQWVSDCALAVFAASAIVWMLGTYVTSGEIPPELGEVVWAAMVITASAALASSYQFSSLSLLFRVLIPSAVLVATAIAADTLGLTLLVIQAVVSGVSVPLAAFTPRELAIRYGLFFAFILAATMPAMIVATYLWGWLFSRLQALSSTLIPLCLSRYMPSISVMLFVLRVGLVGASLWLRRIW